MTVSNDGFDFNNEIEYHSNNQVIVGICVIEIQCFCQEQNNNFSILYVYPTIKSAFLEFNILLPSSAQVETTFSIATMFTSRNLIV